MVSSTKLPAVTGKPWRSQTARAPAAMTRRTVLASALAATAGGILPLNRAPAAAQAAPWFVPIADLPVFPVDVAASIARQRITVPGFHPETHPFGAIFVLPPGARIEAGWWGLRVPKHTALRDGARLVLMGDARNPPLLAAPGKEGVLELQNLSRRRIAFTASGLDIIAGTGGDAVRVDRATAATLQDLRISGGKNGIFATHHPTHLELDRCRVRRAGRGDGYTHNVYTGYIATVTVRDCDFDSPAAQGHVFKCYARVLDVRNSRFAHYAGEDDLTAGFFGGLPLIDRGAWGDTVFADNLLSRRGPVRPVAIDLRNRSFPPGFRPHVLPGWGTEELPHQAIDNRNLADTRLFRHVFYRNIVRNGLLADGRTDPAITWNPGIFLRNNGSAPWNTNAGGHRAGGSMPGDWREHHERSVAFLIQNRVEGVPFRALGQRWAYRRPDIITPIREDAHAPAWLRDWAGL